MDPAQQSPSLRIQTVLYRPRSDALVRFLSGLTAATRQAQRFGWFRHIELAIGDCSHVRSVTYEQETELSNRLANDGVDLVAYRFFNENLGSAEGHNALLREFDTDLLIIVNPDVYVAPDVLRELLRPLDDPKVGIVEARQLPLEHPKAYDSITGDTSWASTACCLVRGELINEIKGFDSANFFLYCDDVDFSWRARLADYRVVHQPSAKVFHDKRLKTNAVPEVSGAEVYYSAEAALLMAWKYSRPDLAEAWADELMSSANPEQIRAVESFRRRKADGLLPEPLDPAGRVATFVAHQYAEHRFVYSE